MEVIRASKAGFCMGVSLALKKLETAINNNEQSLRICTIGPIIHNPQVLNKFASQGVVCLDNASQVQIGDFAIIRAHGITRQEENLLRAKCAKVEDATCPKVKKAQLSIAEATENGATLLLFGDAAHPEVRGLVSYGNGKAIVFENLEELANIDPNGYYVLASQTTQDRKAFIKIASNLADRLSHLIILFTICDATRERQEEAIKLASKVDIMVVVGGKESGNTRRLADLTREAGIDTVHIETVAELNKDDFKNKKTVGLTAGASTPKEIIDEVELWLKNI